jgi:putative glutamate/gamma-aminobutyrate antiporter
MADGKSLSGKSISVFILAMINVAAIASLRGLPAMAEYGLSSVFYYVFVAIGFFIPTALVSAELATGWPKKGGIYSWVKEAFGEQFGFLSISLQWLQNVIWYPTVLSFTGATLAFIINPELASNNLYMIGVILVVYWGATLLNFRGMKTSGIFSSVGVIAGTMLPALLIIVLAAIWFMGGNPLQIEFTADALIPDIASLSTIVLAASVLLSMAGMEMSAVHAREVKDPQKDYPKAILFSTIIILAIFILGTLAIAMVVPSEKISLVAGVMEAFTDFLGAYGLGWLVPIIAILIVLGAVGQVSTWIVGPSKGLFATADDGCLPPFFQKLNKNKMPVNMLLAQAGVVTVLSLIFLLMPSVSSSYWILTALTAQLYLIMYLFLFASAIKLRYSRPNVRRPYKIPFGNKGMWLVAGIGILSSVFGIFIGFFPPVQFDMGSPIVYVGFLLAGIVVFAGLPLLVHSIRKPEWAKPKKIFQEQIKPSGGSNKSKAERISNYVKGKKRSKRKVSQVDKAALNAKSMKKKPSKRKSGKSSSKKKK